jgi:hypothetical protein
MDISIQTIICLTQVVVISWNYLLATPSEDPLHEVWMYDASDIDRADGFEFAPDAYDTSAAGDPNVARIFDILGRPCCFGTNFPFSW